MEKRFLLVDVNVLPEVFLRVLRAKELLASGAAKNISVLPSAVVYLQGIHLYDSISAPIFELGVFLSDDKISFSLEVNFASSDE